MRPRPRRAVPLLPLNLLTGGTAQIFVHQLVVMEKDTDEVPPQFRVSTVRLFSTVSPCWLQRNPGEKLDQSIWIFFHIA